MSVQETIERKLSEGLAALHLEVTNESGQHNVPAGSESHFKVVVVSNDFEDKNLVAQHRLVYKLLGSELARQRPVRRRSSTSSSTQPASRWRASSPR